MNTLYQAALKANVTLDEQGAVRAIQHLDEYREIEALRGREAAAAYVREIAPVFGLAPPSLEELAQPVSFLDPQEQRGAFRFGEDKPAFDGATYSWHQTHLNLPVWAAGITATLKQAPARVVGATNTSQAGVDAVLPAAEALQALRRVFEQGEKFDGVRDPKAASGLDQPGAAAALHDLLGLDGQAAAGEARVSLIRGRFYVYRYDPAERTDPHAAQPGQPVPTTGAPPVVKHDAQSFAEEAAPAWPQPLRAVPDELKPGSWRVVAELIVRLPVGGERMNWRILMDVATRAILYVRALTSGVRGLVFERDPSSRAGVFSDAASAALNPLRDDVLLHNLDAPSGFPPRQALAGTWARLADLDAPTLAPPTQPAGVDFDYDARSNEFAAVNAYHHTDRFFRMVQDLGFALAGAAGYFGGTSFPVETDARGWSGVGINAHCVGDGDGIDHTCYALANLADTASPIGIATDWRVVLHELGGHGILYDHVNVANFGFAHSAGDSFAAVLGDVRSGWHVNPATVDRFQTFPFVLPGSRRHDRAWGWGGAQDVGGYASEQILSTTLFRVYRSLGGDATDVGRREFAARTTAYLILRAVGTLTPLSNPANAQQFLNALLAADAGDWTSEGLAGGAYGKVLAWAFEKQNLNGGARPAVDVYIDDGRAGEYAYLPVHWATQTIWNRRAPDGLPGHQEPALGEVNHAYVKISNRGTTAANHIVVKGYHCKPSAGVVWPNDLTPLTTPQLSAGSLAPNDTQETIVGPFAWTPNLNAWGHDCMFMIVSADGDPSNVDKLSLGEAIAEWRLVPHDNNVGQRNVHPVPGGGGIKGLIAGLHGKGFWIGNPLRTTARLTVDLELPPLLTQRGWRIELQGLAAEGERFKPHEQRALTFVVHAGADFSPADVRAAGAMPQIVATARADGAIIGGMSYAVDAELEMPWNDRPKDDGRDACKDKARELLDCMHIPAEQVDCISVRRIQLDVKLKGGCDCD